MSARKAGLAMWAYGRGGRQGDGGDDAMLVSHPDHCFHLSSHPAPPCLAQPRPPSPSNSPLLFSLPGPPRYYAHPCYLFSNEPLEISPPFCPSFTFFYSCYFVSRSSHFFSSLFSRLYLHSVEHSFFTLFLFPLSSCFPPTQSLHFMRPFFPSLVYYLLSLHYLPQTLLSIKCCIFIPSHFRPSHPLSSFPAVTSFS